MNQITQVREALTALLNPLGQVTAYPGPVEYAKGPGFDRRHYVVRVVVPSAERLDQLLADDGDLSVKATLERDRTLDGAVDHLSVLKCSGYQRYPVPGGDPNAVGAEWTIEILTE